MSEATASPPSNEVIAENIRKWVEALRSEKYKQGHGQLRKGDEYCCLGVGGEVLGCEWISRDLALPFEIKDDKANSFEIEYFTGVLPDSLAHQLGIDRNDNYRFVANQAILYGKNDAERQSFAQIADYIEQSILPLYTSETA